MTIDNILEMMEDLIDKSSSMPFSGKKMIDADQMREYIDSIRYNMPAEIAKAKQTEAEEREIIAKANDEAEQIIRKAEERAKALVAQEEIIKQAREVARQELEKAKEEADAIVHDAKEKEKNLKEALAANLEKILSDAEQALVDSGKALGKSLEQVSGTKQSILRVNGK